MSTAVLIWELSEEGVCEYANEAFWVYTGLVRDLSAVRVLKELVDPRDVELLEFAWREVIDGAIVRDIGAKIRSKRGEYFDFNIHIEAKCRTSKSKSYIFSAVDTCSIVPSESENGLHLAFNALPILIWSSDAKGDADFFNQKWIEYTGLSVAQAVEYGWRQAVHPSDVERVDEYWEELRENGKHGDFEARFRNASGDYRWFLFQIAPLKNSSGRVIRWYGYNADINDRKVAENSVRRSEMTLLEAQRIARMGSFSRRIHTSDVLVHDITWSEGLYKIFEIEKGTPVNFGLMSQRIHPDDVSMWWEKIVVAQKASRNFETEIRLVMANGALKYITINAHLTQDIEGRPEYIGTVQDITQRRLAENALIRAHAELAQSTRSTSLRVLIASIMHEINQPLSGIMINASACVQMLSDERPEVDRALETSKRTIRDADRASKIIARLRGLFEQKKINIEAFDVNDMIRETLGLQLGELQQHQITLKENLSPDVPLIEADRIQLQQVVLNLLRNAVESVSATQGRARDIDIRTEYNGQRIIAYVCDSGIGLKDGEHEQLFEPFHTTKLHGMGIGLYLSRSIVEAHGGTLTIAKNSGYGITAIFSLPAHGNFASE
jgi:PAS domain S-box-containing protein